VMLGLLPSSLRPSPLWTMGAAAFASLVLGWGLVDRSQRDRIERDEAIARAGTDPLTGTRSRAALRPALDAAGSDPAAPAVLLYLDLDHFKQVNDRHGHAAGDRCLQRFAQRCRDQLRGVDVLARQGGEEFIALLPGSTLADGLLVAERIRAAVAADTRAGPSTTVSIGAAQRLPGEPVNEWMSRADAALYRAKSGGRNRVEAA
jgi:diguanylate cyclase (GGDEF)-like protein